jgi:hypothetical protein
VTSPAARGSDGLYTHPVTGEKFPSYSSVASMLDKPALKYWAANRVADAVAYHPRGLYLEMARLLFQAKENGEELDPQDAYYHALRGAPWRERDEKADLGTAVHAAIERYQVDELPGIYPEKIAPYMVQFEGFLRDHKPRIIANEVTVYNRTVGYAGTLDILAAMPVPDILDAGQRSEQLAIVDIKTGKDVYPDSAIQQNAYANGEVWFDTWQQKDVDMPKIEAAYILHVRPTFYSLIPVTLSQANFDVFCNLRDIWEWDRNHKASALGKKTTVKVK